MRHRGLSLLGASLSCGLPRITYSKDQGLESHPALKFGMPRTSRMRLAEDFVVCFDYRTRNPSWVVEKLTLAKLEAATGGGRRGGEAFREASDVPARFRSRLAHYKGSGLDRGHLAPAADHASSKEALRDTFQLDNVSPQVGAGFNRDGWARLEQFARDATRRCDAVFVCTGPLWLPGARDDAGKLRMTHAVLGDPPAVTHVPTHFFKVIVAEEHAGERYAVGCFVLPNAALPPDVDLADYLVPLAALEAAAGVLPFADLLTAPRRAALVAAEDAWLARRRPAGGRAPLLDARDHDADHVRKRDRATDVVHLLDAFPARRLAPRKKKAE